ncbi:Asparagine synthetase domain-containing protein 1 [Sarcoptes scabiei]|uniref:Asparagine synthetase domain-containing protein 1 n=1 Tax=Sarcoptes scabiei TaxID=52283 RepID=A0A834RG52_SARSC|nr:Asparagine synthetase domain-containing protein 1 [Sarcoptes scabiei]
MESSVLGFQGDMRSFCKQPCLSRNGCALQWNGEIFELHPKSVFDFRSNSSDTEVLCENLSKTTTTEQITSIISSIIGPWSMTFWHSKLSQLWIGRDTVGRRTLCWNSNYREKLIIISSIVIDFKSNSIINNQELKFLEDCQFEEIPANRLFCCDFNFSPNTSERDLENDCLDQCTRLYERIENINWNQPIEISSLPNCSVPKRFNTDLPEADLDEVLRSSKFIIPNYIVDQFYNVLLKSIDLRANNQPNLCKSCILTSQQCSHSSLAILFSGGIDSTVIAALAHLTFKPDNRPIDLLNVAFDQDASDRQTGIESWLELCAIYPTRPFNFVEIDIGPEELGSLRETHIRCLMEPKCTVMDYSIGCAVWFAARGRGLIRNKIDLNSRQPYQSPARIIFVGMGADEQLGGYSRYRSHFKKSQPGDWKSLIDELQFDIGKISIHNLGRDDRVVGDHGVEARLPYLDENVINFLNNLPVWLKCNLYLERGRGEKWLLREVAQKLGLKNSARNLKRAIQFGSKIVRHQNGSVNGYDDAKKLF